MSGARCEDCKERGKPHSVANSRLRCQTQDLFRAAVSKIDLFFYRWPIVVGVLTLSTCSRDPAVGWPMLQPPLQAGYVHVCAATASTHQSAFFCASLTDPALSGLALVSTSDDQRRTFCRLGRICRQRLGVCVAEARELL